jgi:hypothetical protein
LSLSVPPYNEYVLIKNLLKKEKKKKGRWELTPDSLLGWLWAWEKKASGGFPGKVESMIRNPLKAIALAENQSKEREESIHKCHTYGNLQCKDA